MIQWYPGHMAKALREMQETIKLVDIIIILLDARIPYSSMNPSFRSLFQQKKQLYVMTKKDKADPSQTAKWLQYYEQQGLFVISVNNLKNSETKNTIFKKVDELMAEKRQSDIAKGIKKRTVKAMVVGIPNVGKSTLINVLVGKKVAQAADRPGVTRNKQWLKVGNDMELLDTPGVLWPKFEVSMVAQNLAITGAIKDTLFNEVTLATASLAFMRQFYPHLLFSSYPKLAQKTNSEDFENDLYTLASAQQKVEQVALSVINDLRQNKLGKITFDRFECLHILEGQDA